jgi:hypothetical protein
VERLRGNARRIVGARSYSGDGGDQIKGVGIVSIELRDLASKSQNVDPARDLENDVVKVMRTTSTECPSDFGFLMSRNRLPRCSTPNAAVGSSRSTTLGFLMMQRQIAMPCRRPSDRRN